MPACITHNLFAKNVLRSLPEQNHVDSTAFLWGAQGPDFFFCHRYLPWMRGRSLSAYGGKIHRAKPSETLGIFRQLLHEHPQPAYRSYVWGFLCHYALDSIAHPYINARSVEWASQRPPQTPGTMHGEIEAALDAIYLRNQTGQLSSSLSLGSMFPNAKTTQEQMARLYQPLLHQLFGVDASEAELIQCCRDTHLVFSLITDRTGIKMRLFERIERNKPHTISSHIVPLTEDPELDYANISHMPWKMPNAEESTQDFFELTEAAQEKAVELITQFDGADLYALTQDKPFG